MRLPPATVLGAVGAGGLVAIVVGTFLPWLHSGRATHNSYQTDGALQQCATVDADAVATGAQRGQRAGAKRLERLAAGADELPRPR